MIYQFAYGFFSTLGFTILYNIPKKHMITASFVGASGWITFQHFNIVGDSSIFACFMGSLVISFLSEFFARVCKEAVTIFVIPGILPLVPGAGMYYTMLAFLENDFTKLATTGSETILMAGSIAIAILIISSFTKIFATVRHYLASKKPAYQPTHED